MRKEKKGKAKQSQRREKKKKVEGVRSEYSLQCQAEGLGLLSSRNLGDTGRL